MTTVRTPLHSWSPHGHDGPKAGAAQEKDRLVQDPSEASQGARSGQPASRLITLNQMDRVLEAVASATLYQLMTPRTLLPMDSLRGHPGPGAAGERQCQTQERGSGIWEGARQGLQQLASTVAQGQQEISPSRGPQPRSRALPETEGEAPRLRAAGGLVKRPCRQAEPSQPGGPVQRYLVQSKTE